MQLVSRGDLRGTLARRPNQRGEDADAARREVLVLESGALEDSSERFIRGEPSRNSVGSVVTHDIGDIHELQARLAGEICKRLSERLRGNVGGEFRGFNGLS